MCYQHIIFVLHTMTQPLTLYIYDHCPYCVRARMPLGIKNIPHNLITLSNDDEATPLSLIGTKQVPILTKADGTHLPESLDIVTYLDETYGDELLFTPPTSSENSKKLHIWLDSPRPYAQQLCYPRWVEAPLGEFETEAARRYFTKKKEEKIGKFGVNRQHSRELIQQAQDNLFHLESLITSAYAVHGTLSSDDILLFPILRSLTIVSGLTLPPKADEYTRCMAEMTKIPLHWCFAN